MRVTRLAPSPTGALHLGNARTFLATWLVARKRGWTIRMRIEDLDGPRIKPGAAQQAIDDLRWLGLDWDGDIVYQSSRLSRYREAVDSLVASGFAYPCTCSRKEIEQAASAPHASDGAAVYPGTCRDRYKSVEDAIATGRPTALRIDVCPPSVVGFGGKGVKYWELALDINAALREQPRERLPRPVTYIDEFAGPKRMDLVSDIGDFVLTKPDGTPSYQLAVVVDDLDAGVTDVIRGDDLLDSVPRQVLLHWMLGCADRVPVYRHLPLVVGEDGRRLAKRHGDTRLSTYREGGTSPGRVRALLGRWLGLAAAEELSIEEMLEQFVLARVLRKPITMTAADDAFLRGSHVR